MAHHEMVYKVSRVFGDNPSLAFRFFCMASEIVDDFDDYGPYFQANENGVYDETTAIEKLRRARDEMIELVDQPTE